MQNFAPQLLLLLRESFLQHTRPYPLDELKQLRDFFARLVELRTEEEELIASLAPTITPPVNGTAAMKPPPMVPRENITAPPNPPAKEPLARKPMRPPRPGTTRAIIYGVLNEQGGRPMRRAEIVEEVARLRGQPVEQTLKSVAAVLKDRHDPHIARLGHGEYAYRSEAGNETWG